MNKTKISFYFIFISVFTFLAIFLTIVQASYNNLINPTKQVETEKYLEPLNPALDSEIIQEIEKRQNPDDNDEVTVNSIDETDETTIDSTPEILITPTSDDNTQPISTTEENL